MARAIWTGSINFGLVAIPVGLYSATEDHTIHFHQFERGTGDRIRYQRVNERTGVVMSGAVVRSDQGPGGSGVDGRGDALDRLRWYRDGEA